MLDDSSKVNTEDLYVALATHAHGTNVYITDTGAIETMSQNTHSKEEERLYYGSAFGDWHDAEWGICYFEDEESGASSYHVEGLDASYEERADACQAAVDEFGITAEVQDELIERIEERISEEKKELEERAFREN